MHKSHDSIVIISYGAIGDFVMTLLLIEALHKKYGGRVMVAATRNAPLLREIAAAYPYVEVRSLSAFTALPLMLRSLMHRTLVVVPPTFYRTSRFIAAWARLAAARGATAGLRGPRDTVSLDIAVPFDPSVLFYRNLSDLAVALGAQPIAQAKIRFVEDASAVPKGRYVAIAPFGSNPGKTLPMERWALLLHHLAAAYPQLPVVLLGAPGDAAAAQRLVRDSGHRRAFVRCGAPFAQVAALIAHAACFIGPDSGPTHVAGVLGVPSVVVDNLRSVTWLPAYNAKAVVLTESRNCACGGDKTEDCNYIIDGVAYLRCMYDVSDERIRSAADGILSHA